MAIENQAEFDRIFAKANELWDTEFFRKHAHAAIEAHLDEVRNDFGCQLHSGMRNLESPLEAAFLAWWRMVSYRSCGDYSLFAQRDATVGGRVYRLDFTVEPLDYGFLQCLVNSPDCPKIAIELDGHEFHERTKEQVTYRNRRDRDLQADGWIVLHVSGSEFNANPKAVTMEIRERASTLLYAAYHAQRKTA